MSINPINPPSYFTDSITDDIPLPNFSKYIYDLNATIKFIGQQSNTENDNMIFEDSKKFTPMIINPEVEGLNLYFTPYIKLTKFDLQKSNADRYKEKTKLATKDYIKFFTNKNLIYNFITYKKTQFENENKDDDKEFGEEEEEEEQIGGRKLPKPSEQFFKTGIPADNEEEEELTMGRVGIGPGGEPPTRYNTEDARRHFYNDYLKELLIKKLLKYYPRDTLERANYSELEEEAKKKLLREISKNEKKLLKKYKLSILQDLSLEELENIVKKYIFEEKKNLLDHYVKSDLDEMTFNEFKNVLQKEEFLQKALEYENITDDFSKEQLEGKNREELEDILRDYLLRDNGYLLRLYTDDLTGKSVEEIEEAIEKEHVLENIATNKPELIAKYSDPVLVNMFLEELNDLIKKEDLLDSIHRKKPELIDKFSLEELERKTFKELQRLEKKEEILEDNLNFIKRLFFSKGDTIYLKGKPYKVQKSNLDSFIDEGNSVNVNYTVYVIEGTQISFLKKQKFNCAIRGNELDEDVQKIFSVILNTIGQKARPKLTPVLAPDLQGKQFDHYTSGHRSHAKYKSRDSRERRYVRDIKDYIGKYIRDYQRKYGYPDTRYPPLRVMMIDSENKFPEKLGRNLGEILDFLHGRYHFSHNINDKKYLVNIIKDYQRTYNLQADANKGINDKYKRERDEEMRQRIGNTIIKNIIRHGGSSSKRKLRKSKNTRKPKKPRKTRKRKKSRKQRKNTRKKARKHRRTRKRRN